MSYRRSYCGICLTYRGRKYRVKRKLKKPYARKIKLNPKKYPRYKAMEDNWLMESYERSLDI